MIERSSLQGMFDRQHQPVSQAPVPKHPWNFLLNKTSSCDICRGIIAYQHFALLCINCSYPYSACKQSERPCASTCLGQKTHVSMNHFVASINITPKDKEHFIIYVSRVGKSIHKEREELSSRQICNQFFTL